jgi:adenylate kinase
MIYVGGIHGVGKDTLCNKLEKAIGIKKYSASELIKSGGGIVTDNKSNTPVSNNQKLLVNAVNRLKENENNFLLSGHFCLLNRNNEIENIDISIIKSIAPKAILVLTENPTEIKKRILERNNINGWSLEFIKKFQQQEIQTAIAYSKSLSVPILKANSTSEYSSIENFIKNFKV